MKIEIEYPRKRSKKATKKEVPVSSAGKELETSGLDTRNGVGSTLDEARIAEMMKAVDEAAKVTC